MEHVDKLANDLLLQLSIEATVSTDPLSRWSTYKAPKPVFVVNVRSATDVATTVKFCNANGLPFLAQNGGGGWAAFPETKALVIISLGSLNSTVVAADKQSAVIGGGARVSETIAAAHAAGVLVLTGNCNGVGTLGATLGGGYGNLMGQVGLGIDNILEMEVVTADGELRTVSASQEKELFWAMRGAGPNFGIVTSATIKAYPVPENERSAWCGALIYTEDKLESVVEALERLELSSHMVVFMYFGSSGPPSHDAVIIITPWLFQGSPESGKEAFKSLYEIGPMVENTAVLPYSDWNTGANPFCTHSERKPSFGAGLDKLEPQAWRDVWNTYVDFQTKATAHASVILLEAYPMTKKRLAGEKLTAFPHRSVRFNAAVLTWYTDKALDEEAVQCGKDIRELWRKSSGRDETATYINFAHGDEPLEEIYGDSLPHLRELKSKWDPQNRFNQWFNIR